MTESRPETSNPDTEPPQFIDEQEIKQELMDKFDRLLEEEELTELEYYRLKSQLLENPQDFMRKYQMGTREGVRPESRSELREGRDRDRGEDR